MPAKMALSPENCQKMNFFAVAMATVHVSGQNAEDHTSVNQPTYVCQVSSRSVHASGLQVGDRQTDTHTSRTAYGMTGLGKALTVCFQTKSQMSRSIQRIAQGLSGCKASSDDERHCQQLQDHKINGSSGSLQTCHSRSNTCELALRVYVQGAVSKNVKAVEGIDSQRRVTFITIPWNDDQLSDLMMNEGDMSRKRIVIGGWKSLKMVFEKNKNANFRLKTCFLHVSSDFPSFQTKKIFSTSENFSKSQLTRKKLSFRKKSKFEFSTPNVFSTRFKWFPIVWDQKNFFRPPKIFRSPKHAFGAISNSQISKSTTNMNTSLLEPLEIIG